MLGAIARLTSVVVFGLVLTLAPGRRGEAQDRAGQWWVGVFSIDAGTVLTLTADHGREVRRGARPGETRHGIEVPLTVDPSGERVEMTIEAAPGSASRWTLTRVADEVIVEEWRRRTTDPHDWARVRTVRAPLPR